MKQSKAILILIILLITATTSSAKKQDSKKTVYAELPTSSDNTSRQYSNLDYGLRIQVRDKTHQEDMTDISQLPSKIASKAPIFVLEFPLKNSAEQYLYNSARTLGFQTGSDLDNDYLLVVNITDYRLRMTEYNQKSKRGSASSTMIIDWQLLTADNKVAITQTTSIGRKTARETTNFKSILAGSFTEALDGIDWNAIAQKLRIGRTAKDEKNKKVEGNGNTALESTVIRWYIASNPQGADVSWRVVSSTPDVKNTNSNYIGTTPYETTESFDIKGLTYNNSGNVQIEVTCERRGYLTQRKRFNLRQVIDQKEISTKFNLVKENEDDDNPT